MVELTFILREKLKLDVQDEQISLILREFDKVLESSYSMSNRLTSKPQ